MRIFKSPSSFDISGKNKKMDSLGEVDRPVYRLVKTSKGIDFNIRFHNESFFRKWWLPSAAAIFLAAGLGIFGILRVTAAPTQTTIGANIATGGNLTVGGNVGIGTTSPFTTLGVNGDVVITGRIMAGSLGGPFETVTGTRMYPTYFSLSQELKDFSVYPYQAFNYSEYRLNPDQNMSIAWGNVVIADVPAGNTKNISSMFGAEDISVADYGSGTKRWLYGVGATANSYGSAVTYQAALKALSNIYDPSNVGSITYNYGVYADVSTNGTVTNNYGFRVLGGASRSGANVFNNYGLYVKTPMTTGSVGNNYGVYLENQAIGSTSSYSIYSAGGQNYFAGNVGIGTSTPMSALSVNGDAVITGGIAAGNLAGNGFFESATGTNFYPVVINFSQELTDFSTYKSQANFYSLTRLKPSDNVSYVWGNAFNTIVPAENTKSFLGLGNIDAGAYDYGSSSINWLYGGAFTAGLEGTSSIGYMAALRISSNIYNVLNGGNVTYNYGVYADVSTNGTVVNDYGFRVKGGASRAGANVFNNYGLIVKTPYNTGSVGNNYGIYLEDQAIGTTSSYAIYTAGSAQSYFGGHVGIGTSTPSRSLDIAAGSGNAIGPGWDVWSSQAYKKDITYLSDSDYSNILDEISNTPVATYYYKDENCPSADSSQCKKRLGLIAEQSPAEVLSATGDSVSLYDLASFTLAGLKAQQQEISQIKLALGLDSQGAVNNGTSSLAQSSGILTPLIDAIKGALSQLTGTVQTAGDWVFGKITSDSGVTTKDQTTGEYYCMMVKDGQMTSQKGKCGELSPANVNLPSASSSPYLDGSSAVSSPDVSTSTDPTDNSTSTPNEPAASQDGSSE